jgi:peptidyl-prolyl cis-trans isomerase SurA
MKKLVLLGLIGLFSKVPASFAQQQKIVADKIIAEIGDKIILKSDIDNAIADYKHNGQDAQLPPNPECAFLEGQLVQKALVLQAERDSLPVTDDEIDALLDNKIRYFISVYGSQQALEEVAGKSVYEIKEDYRPAFKENKLAEDMRNKILENVKITPAEVEDYYNKIPKDSLRFYESQLELSQIILYPKANQDVVDYVTNELNEWKKEVETGQKKFEALAKVYSDDPGSKDNGGQYSINRNDKNFDPTFMAAAFKLKEGQISPVIKSKFGLHIIQMVSRAGDDAVVRHILKIPLVTDDEVAIAKRKLDSIRADIIAGKIAFNTAVSKYSEDENSKMTAGTITSQDGSTIVTIDQLDKDLIPYLKDMKPGDISQPLSYTDERGTKGVRLVLLKTLSAPHRENLKDDYNRVSERALLEKKQRALENWFASHIPNFYINIDKAYSSCQNMGQWIKGAQTAGK